MAQPARRLHVKRYAVRNIDANYYSAYRMRVEVVAAENMDKRIFLYRRDPVNPYTNEPTDTFFTIASPADLEEFPPEEPDANKAFPFFRKDFVELDFRSLRIAMNAWQVILREISVLIEALNKLEDLEE